MRTLTDPLCTLETQVAQHASAMFGVLSAPSIYEFKNAAPASEAWLPERFTRLDARQSTDGSQQ